MKFLCLLAVILGLCTLPISSQDPCPAGRVCPANFPVRSDGVNAAVDSIRAEITTELRSLLSESSVSSALRMKYLNLVGLYSNFPAVSCAEIYENNENAQNGYYFLSISDEITRSFCRFDFQTSGQLQGWELLTSLDMNNPDTNCPSEFQMVEHESGVRYCRKNSDSNGCTAITYPHNRPIKRLYGRVHGIQRGTPDIFDGIFDRTIEGDYLNGISLTYAHPRQHIWSFIGYTSAAYPNCPCSTNPTISTADYIGENYFCESGTADLEVDPAETFVNDPIWDGQNCESTQDPGCCTRGDLGNGEWFYREFEVPFTPVVELRICTDQTIADEDIGLQLVELYIQ